MFRIDEVQFVKIKNKYILVNLINGAADFIDEEVYISFSSNNFSALGDDIIEKLKQRLYLFDSEEEYRAFLNELNIRLDQLELSSTPNFLVIPSYACNLKCTYCYEQAYEIKHSFTVDKIKNVDSQFETISKIVEKLISQKKLNLRDVKITIMGGEPLLPGNKLVIEHILKTAQEKGYGVNIITNGVNIFTFIESLVKYQVEHIQITLDGPKSIHDKRRVFRNGMGSFEAILENLQKVLENNIKVSLRVNVDSENIESLPQLADILRKLNNNENLKPYLYLLQDGGCSGEQGVIEEKVGIERIYDLIRYHSSMNIFQLRFHPVSFVNSILNNESFQPALRHCGAAKNQYILDYKGNIYKCWHGIGNADYRVGTYGEKIEFNEQEGQWHNRSSIALPKCSSCKYRYICSTGCPAAKHKGSAASEINSPSCVDYEKLIETMLLENFNT